LHTTVDAVYIRSREVVGVKPKPEFYTLINYALAADPRRDRFHRQRIEAGRKSPVLVVARIHHHSVYN